MGDSVQLSLQKYVELRLAEREKELISHTVSVLEKQVVSQQKAIEQLSLQIKRVTEEREELKIKVIHLEKEIDISNERLILSQKYSQRGQKVDEEIFENGSNEIKHKQKLLVEELMSKKRNTSTSVATSNVNTKESINPFSIKEVQLNKPYSGKPSFIKTAILNEYINHISQTDLNTQFYISTTSVCKKVPKYCFQIEYRLLCEVFTDSIVGNSNIVLLKGYPSVVSHKIFELYCTKSNMLDLLKIIKDPQQRSQTRVIIGLFNKCVLALEEMRKRSGFCQNYSIIKDRYPHVQFVALGRYE
ncbi:hypothetical protein ENUP19_0302G0006 [Entamoeba nuttalli]|uniref:Uncharacterized protein n=1 Tax=Entamoeba nuttalli TaxID=412467 RepID=A0ABQ0DT14_9EUKA